MWVADKSAFPQMVAMLHINILVEEMFYHYRFWSV